MAGLGLVGAGGAGGRQGVQWNQAYFSVFAQIIGYSQVIQIFLIFQAFSNGVIYHNEC